ncbi:MAG: MtrB/PioB family outer membrane beta-barrel protein [Spirochaetaceae bacterium]|nr:MtrB/PioB family outer membrane beta-barrel protein [Spirochaetaceae bacterium]HPG24025.1 MtrB/PioB family outer membrane beta-barrel protein [Myxococcota bacterium]
MRRRPASPTRRPLRLFLAPTLVGAIGIAIGLAAIAPSAVAGERESALAGAVDDGARRIDPQGLSTLTPHRRRTPSGLLHPYPLAPLAWSGTDPGLRAWAELGWLASRGEEDEARFREYLDPGDGPWLRRFALETRSRETPFRLSVAGLGVARADASYRAQADWVNRLRVRAHYDALEHVYAGDARVLFEGAGTDRLTLPVGLTPGDNPGAAVAAALADVPPSRIAQKRNESGIELRMRLRPDLTGFATYRLERRDGERPFGGTLGTTFGSTSSGSVVETLEPIQSRLHEGTLGLELSRAAVQARVDYRLSHFDNRLESLVWENPFAATDLGFLQLPGVPRGRIALAPDNTTHRLSADLAARTPLAGRFTASAAWSRMEQDERLLPATTNDAITEFRTLIRSHAEARVDTWLLRGRWQIRPLRSLSLSLAARYFVRDNDTRYVALDPTTGGYGYVIEDTATTGRVGPVPFSHRRFRATAQAEWRIVSRTRLGLELSHESLARSRRARHETREDALRVHLATHAIPGSTWRLAYALESRSGSGYDPTRDRDYYLVAPGSVLLSGPPRSLTSFRQVDLARHTTHAIDLRTNFLLGPSTDLSLAARYSIRDYGARHGVQDEQAADLNVDVAWQPSPRVRLHAFGSFEWRTRRLETIDARSGPVGDLRPGGFTFPLANEWSWDSRTKTFALGTGLALVPVDSITLELDYRFQASDEGIDTSFDPTGDATTPTVPAGSAARTWPAVRLRDHLLAASLRKDWSARVATTLLYRLQHSEIEDRSQRGLVPLVNQNLYLGHRDDDFVAHVVGATATLRY